MKTLVVYTSQTGFTKRYAEWIAKRTQAVVIELEEAKKKKDSFFDEFDAIVYGGWAMAGSVVKVKWFFDKATVWREKRLAVFVVGASPRENPDVDTAMQNLLTDEQKGYIKAFYCQGGLNYDNMKLPSKLMMKAFASAIKRKKNPTDMERDMAKWIDHSYDISDEKFVEPIVNYIEEDI